MTDSAAQQLETVQPPGARGVASRSHVERLDQSCGDGLDTSDSSGGAGRRVSGAGKLHDSDGELAVAGPQSWGQICIISRSCRDECELMGISAVSTEGGELWLGTDASGSSPD